MTLTVGSLFSGIGGLELGLERAGMTTAWQVEQDLFCQRVLAKHWPAVPRYGDIRAVDFRTIEPVDLICGGFPCQPFSLAGKGEGTADERWLWPEFARAIRDVRPKYVVVENVPGLRHRNRGALHIVLGELAGMGFDAEWGSFRASDVGAPHLRERLLLVAYTNGPELRLEPGWGSGADRQSPTLPGLDGAPQPLAHTNGQGQLQQGGSLGEVGGRASDSRREGGSRPLATPHCSGLALGQGVGGYSRPQLTPPERGGTAGAWWSAEPDVGRVAHGIPSRMDRLRTLGNAVVPQVAEWVGRYIMAAEAEAMAA